MFRKITRKLFVAAAHLLMAGLPIVLLAAPRAIRSQTAGAAQGHFHSRFLGKATEATDGIGVLLWSLVLFGHFCVPSGLRFTMLASTVEYLTLLCCQAVAG